MPPYYSPPSFEVIEAKTWATACVESLLSEATPISFEPAAPPVVIRDRQQQQQQPPLRSRVSAPVRTPIEIEDRPRANPVRRSLSLLETNLFHPSRSSSDQQQQQRSKTLYEKHTTHINRPLGASKSTTLHQLSQAAAAKDTPQPNKQSKSSRVATPQPSSSSSSSFPLSRLKRSFDVKYLFSSSISIKERNGIAIWKRTFHDALAAGETKQFKQQSPRSAQLSRFITTELLTTEETYLDHLIIIKKIFMDPLMEAATAHPRPLVNIKDVQIIFAYIPQLIMLSTSLLRRLRDAQKSSSLEDDLYRPPGVGKVFCDLLDQFDIYIFYAANFSRSQRCAAKAKNRNIVCRQLVQEKRMNRMGLSDYAIAPIQRITRYCLLLKDLLKHSSPSHHDYPYLDRALKCMSALALAMNNIQ